jgi:parvulin-like peptidyl-prolyl isomerase
MTPNAARLMIAIIAVALATALTGNPGVAGTHDSDRITPNDHRTGAAVVASVNNETITEERLYARMTLQYGHQALTNLIDARVVSGYAKGKGIAVSDADLEAKIAEIKQQFGGEERFAAALKNHGQTLALFKQDLALTRHCGGY